MLLADKIVVLSCALSFSGPESDILGTQSPKCLRLKGISNQFPLEYTVVKCQYNNITGMGKAITIAKGHEPKLYSVIHIYLSLNKYNNKTGERGSHKLTINNYY